MPIEGSTLEADARAGAANLARGASAQEFEDAPGLNRRPGLAANKRSSGTLPPIKAASRLID